MRISEALRGVALLGVETSPFIYFVEQHPVYVGRMRDVFRRVDEGNPRIVTSVITLTEILVLPIETGNQAYEQAYREMLLNTETIRLERVSVAIAEQAARLRARYNLRTPDALHIATAITAGCDAFLTNDRALRRADVIRVLVLDELEVDTT